MEIKQACYMYHLYSKYVRQIRLKLVCIQCEVKSCQGFHVLWARVTCSFQLYIIFLLDTVRIWEFSPMWTDFDKCHLSKRNVKLILKVLSDLEPLRGSSNKKTLYSTRSRFIRVLKWPTRAKKGPIYTQTRQINYYFRNNCSFFLVKQDDMSHIS
jgi:hypothetical protein